MSKFNRIHLVVLDSVGIGAAPDANKLCQCRGFQMELLTHWDTFSKTVGLNVPKHG